VECGGDRVEQVVVLFAALEAAGFSDGQEPFDAFIRGK
jgi:hypothetical protein